LLCVAPLRDDGRLRDIERHRRIECDCFGTGQWRIYDAWGKLEYTGTEPVTIRLSLELDRTGQLIRVEVLNPGAHQALDRSALEAVYRAAPFGPVPDEFAGDHLTLNIEILVTAD